RRYPAPAPHLRPVPPMSQAGRAAQFAPLSGHSVALAEIARLTYQRSELDEDTQAALDLTQQFLLDSLDQRPELTVNLVPAGRVRKASGWYVITDGRLR